MVVTFDCNGEPSPTFTPTSLHAKRVLHRDGWVIRGHMDTKHDAVLVTMLDIKPSRLLHILTPHKLLLQASRTALRSSLAPRLL